MAAAISAVNAALPYPAEGWGVIDVALQVAAHDPEDV